MTPSFGSLLLEPCCSCHSKSSTDNIWTVVRLRTAQTPGFVGIGAYRSGNTTTTPDSTPGRWQPLHKR